MLSHAKKRNLVTLSLFVGIAALLTALALFENPSLKTSLAINDAHSPDNIVQVQINLPNKPEIALERPDNNSPWLMRKPVLLPGNEQRIAPLIGILNQFEARYNTAELDLNEVGLTQPQATLTLNGEAMLIGAKALDGDRRYAQLKNNVGFVPEWVLSLLNGGIPALATLNVFSQQAAPTHLQNSDGNKIELNNAELWKNLIAAQMVLAGEYSPEPDAQRFKILSSESLPNEIGELIVQQAFSIIKVDDTFLFLFDNDTIGPLLPRQKP